MTGMPRQHEHQEIMWLPVSKTELRQPVRRDPPKSRGDQAHWQTAMLRIQLQESGFVRHVNKGTISNFYVISIP